MASIENHRSIHNPQKSFMWEVEILPTGAQPALDQLKLHAQTAAIPEKASETFQINFKAEFTTYNGRVTSGRTINISFFEDEAKTVYQYFHAWRQLMNADVNGAGNTRDVYQADIVIRQMASDDTTTTAVHTLYGAFPTNIGEFSLDYSSNEAMILDITFAFQHHDFE